MAENINAGTASDKTSEQTPGTSPPNDILLDLLGKFMAAQPQASSPVDTDTPRAQTSNNANPPQGDMLSSLLSNPELLSKLPQLLSIIQPLMGSMQGNGAQSQPAQPAVAIKPTDSGDSRKQSPSDCRAALLCAMKPYLGKERRDAVDYIVKLSKLGDILKTL